MLPAVVAVQAEARSERQAREAQERTMNDSRDRVLLKQAKAEANAEAASRIAEENLRLATEINKALKRE